jgi:hypothetical protein
MELIPIRNTDEIVSIKIFVDYKGPSKSMYLVNNAKIFRYSSDQVPPKPFPHVYPIGKGMDLLPLANRNNNWNFQLVNPTENGIDYEIYIEWWQGEDKAPLYTWEVNPADRTGNVPATTDPTILEGSSRYITATP